MRGEATTPYSCRRSINYIKAGLQQHLLYYTDTIFDCVEEQRTFLYEFVINGSLRLIVLIAFSQTYVHTRKHGGVSER